jgi:polyketide synthase 12/myxalamid-type polyketide synthase MxaF
LEASLGLTISATLIWTYPTLAALTAHLAEQLASPGDPPPAPVNAAPGVPEALRQTAAKIADLSEAEMEKLLLEKLAGKGKATAA